MEHQTEAACLIGAGAQYSRRIGLRSAGGGTTFAGFKSAAFSLYFDDEPIYHFDLEGRWQRAFVEGSHYLKGLDGAVDAIDRVREGDNLVLHRRKVDFAEAVDLDETIRCAAFELIGRLTIGDLVPIEPPPPARPPASGDLIDFLERIGRWDTSAWFADRERYLAAYGGGSMPFLPPDCQHTLVVQATLGSADRSVFDLAGEGESYVRSQVEFNEHLRAVKSLLGERLLQYRGVFLSGRDVLRRSVADVSAWLESIGKVFPIEPDAARGRSREMLKDSGPQLEGIDAFLDDFGEKTVDQAVWSRWRSLHLKRVTIGIESGDPAVRALYGKAWENEVLRQTVARLKGAGIATGVVVLVGAGGSEHAESHLLKSAELVLSLELGSGDLVYLIDANELGGGAGKTSPGLDLAPLPSQALLEQQARFKAMLAPLQRTQRVKIAPYRMSKQ